MNKSILFAVVFLLAVVLSPSTGQAKTLEDLLVEKGVISKTEAAGTSAAEQAKVYWNKGTRFEFPDSGFTTGFSFLMQERYTNTDYNEGSGLKNTSSFNMNTARLRVSGTALHQEFDYYLQTEFAGSNGSKLLDAYLTWNACDWGKVKMGQYKPAYGRQFRDGENEMQFPDRTAASNYFAVGRQSGLSSSVLTEDKKLIASAGIFNGLSDGEGVNQPGVDTNNAGFAEVRYNPVGQMDSFVEGDIDYTEDLAVSMGAAYGYQDNRNDLGAGLETVQVNGVIADLNAKIQGFSFHGEYFYNSIDADSYASNPDPSGFYTQVGYFFVPKKFEIALRYGLLECDGSNSTGPSGSCKNADKVNEAGVSLNYFFWKNHLKAQLAYEAINQDGLKDKSADVNANKWIFQLSSMF